MENNSKKSLIIGITSLFLVTLILLGLTYAYYRTRIIGNNSNDPSISVTSEKLEIVYADGNGVLTATGIEPGKAITFKDAEGNEANSKTFTITNNGDASVNYALYLEDVVNTFTRTEDLKLTVNCTSNITGNGYSVSDVNYPTIDSLLSTSAIEKNEVHTCELSLEYVNRTDIDQSEDMGKSLSGKVQIYDLTDILSETTLAYKLVSNAMNGTGSTTYRTQPLSMPAQETTTIQEQYVKTTSTQTPNANYYYVYSSEVEFNELAGFTLVEPQIDKYSDIIADPEKLANFKYTRRIKGSYSNTGERTENIRDTYKITSATSTAIQYEELAMKMTSNSVESTLSATLDDYGISYYYRGNVEDNYVTYNNMCWRVVRILGDGSIKLILESESKKCEEITTLDDRDYIITDNKNYAYGATENIDYENAFAFYKATYVNPSFIKSGNTGMRSYLNTWFESKNFDTSDLRKGDWCINNLKDTYSSNYPYAKLDGISGGVIYNAYLRLYRQYPEQASLLCEELGGTIVDDYIGSLTSDEVVFAGAKIGFYSINHLMPQRTSAYDYRLLTVHYREGTTDNAYYGSYGHPDYSASAYGNGYFSQSAVTDGGFGIRPSIILNNNVQYSSGNGTLTSPYTIS